MTRKAFVVWLAIMSVETVHGVLRGLFLTPVVGDVRARQIGVVIGSLLVVAVAAASAEWQRISTRTAQLTVGFAWVVWTLAFEVVLGRFVLGYTWRRILADYDVGQGGFMLVGLLVMTLSPAIAARRSANRRHLLESASVR
jgi:hypothetical protein